MALLPRRLVTSWIYLSVIQELYSSSVLNHPLNPSDYTALGEWYMCNYKCAVRKLAGYNIRYYPWFWLEGVRKVPRQSFELGT
jgi:hypothetical protein